MRRQSSYAARAGLAARPGTELKRARGDRAGGRPQIRCKHKRALTGAQIEIFLSALAETCNVSLAAREAGRKARVFYDLRRRDENFRGWWLEALREGYDLLEMEMVRRARFGAPKDIFYLGRKTATTRIFNDATALRLLHFHRKTIEALRAREAAPKVDAKALFDELAARLAEIEAEASEASGDEDGAL
jgi:hypothetical protein